MLIVSSKNFISLKDTWWLVSRTQISSKSNPNIFFYDSLILEKNDREFFFIFILKMYNNVITEFC